MEIQMPSPITQDWAAFLAGEVLVFGLLGKAVFEYPDQTWLLSLAEEGVFNDLPLETNNPDVQAGIARLQAWATDFRQNQDETAFQLLVDDYTRLFIGPGTLLAPPWGSVYFTKDRLIFQEQTIQVRQWYARFGLQAEKLYQEPDDHIGLELIFLAHLAGEALTALERQAEPVCQELLEQQLVFLREQPLQWANLWCADVLEFSRSEFYRGVAQLIKGVLAYVQLVLESGLKAV